MTRAFSSIILLICAFSVTEASIVQQLTDEKTTSFGTAALDDSGASIFLGSSADLAGDNPEHLFRLLSIDPSTGVSTPIFGAEGGVLPIVSVSDDGALLVFISPADPLGSNPDRSAELFVMQADGSGLQQLTNEPAVDGGSVSSAIISGDGTTILFSSNTNPSASNATERTQLFLINPDGSGLQQLTQFSENALGAYDISDDGSRVVFVHEEDLLGLNPDLGPELFVINADGSNLRQLTDVPLDADLGGAVISGDGSTISFSSDADLTGGNATFKTEIFAIQWDGSGLRQVTTTQVLIGFTGDPASQSPSITDDGSTILYQSNFSTFGTNFDGNFEIFSIQSDGSSQTAITSSLLDIGSVLPTVSGDGSRVAYLDVGNELGLITRTLPSGSATTLATSDLTLISAPDVNDPADRVVYVRSTGLFSGADLWISDVANANPQALTTFGGVSSPSMTGDASWVVFISSANPLGANLDASDEIFRIQTDGTGLQQLTDFPLGTSVSRVTVAADGSLILLESDSDLVGINADGSTELFTLQPNGTNLTQVTDGPLDSSSRAAQIDASASWIVFESDVDFLGSNPDGSFEIWRMVPDGTGLQQITSELVDSRSPSINSDASLIVYRSTADPLLSNPEANEEVYLYSVASMLTSQVTSFVEGNVGAPRMDGNGQWIYFSTSAPVFEDDPDRPNELYRVPVAGGNYERVGGLAAGGLGVPALGLTDTVGVFGGLGDVTGNNPDQLPELWVIDRSAIPNFIVDPAFPTLLRWSIESGPKRYDAIRGSVSNLAELPGGEIDLGSVVCLENDSPDNDTEEGLDSTMPAPGEVFFFLYRGSQGVLDGPGSYGTSSAGGERQASSGDCGL